MLQYRFLLLSLLLGEVFVISTIKGETYCVKVNKNDTCQCDNHVQVDDMNCLTLQYFINNVSTTINKSENGDTNVTLYFMPGNHSVNFTKTVNITMPTVTILKMIGLNLDNNTSTTVSAHRDCPDTENIVDQCGLYFNGSVDKYIIVEIKNLIFHRVSVKLKNANVTLYNSQHLNRSLLNIENSNVNFTGKMRIANSNTFTHCGNIMLSGNITFDHNKAVGGGAMYLESSTLYILNGSTVVFSNNTALYCGGAIFLDGSQIYIAPDSGVTFADNRAYDKGGAIYFEPGITLSQILSQGDDPHRCFYYQWLENSGTRPTHIDFTNNSADSVGDHIYGASRNECQIETNSSLYNITHSNSSPSLVSSDPIRVCLCEKDSNGKTVPQCNRIVKSQDAYPGEILNILVAVMGWDYEMGITNGVVYQSTKLEYDELLHQNDAVSIGGKNCTNVNYTLDLPISFNHSEESITMFMYLTAVKIDPNNELLKCDRGQSNLEACIHYAPITFNLSMKLTCPPGFHLYNQSCDCLHHVIFFKTCYICHHMHSGYFSWERRSWANASTDQVIYAEYCPFNYCKKPQNDTDQIVKIILPDDVDSQCAYNRAGRLCGQCKQDENINFSLAIGSSRCVECSDYKGLSLFVFFAAAGFLLVFFISALNLTVTQGMINGLLFYANIMWAYQSVFLPVPQKDNLDQHWLKDFDYLLRVFIAWVNLDFGIEMCFVKGFNAFAKTLLQYSFPIYLWIIAGTIIISAHHSSKVTNLFGNRAVPVLATLLLLSSTKLLKTILDSLKYTILTKVSINKTICHPIVWSLDGNLDYFISRHALIFLVAVFFFIFLWLPHTLLLFLMQWIQRKSHLRLLKWVPRLTPVYDAYFAPLKDKHHYWFGLLLVTRCLLLTFHMAIKTKVNNVLLLVFTATLLMYGNYYRVYKSKYVQFSENFFFLHLVIIGAVSINDETKVLINVVRASIFLVLLAFCGWVIWNFAMLAKTCYLKRYKKRKDDEYDLSIVEASLIKRDELLSSFTRYRDSILNSTEFRLSTY